MTVGKGKKKRLEICERTETFRLIDGYPRIDYEAEREIGGIIMISPEQWLEISPWARRWTYS
jgi:hypothetical protein